MSDAIPHEVALEIRTAPYCSCAPMLARVVLLVQFTTAVLSTLQLTRAYAWRHTTPVTMDSTFWFYWCLTYLGCLLVATLAALIWIARYGPNQRETNQRYVHPNLPAALYLATSFVLALFPSAALIFYDARYHAAAPLPYSASDTWERLTLWIGMHVLNATVMILGLLQYIITVLTPFAFALPRTMLEFRQLMLETHDEAIPMVPVKTAATGAGDEAEEDEASDSDDDDENDPAQRQHQRRHHHRHHHHRHRHPRHRSRSVSGGSSEEADQ